ncbi:MAG TPA: phosphodiester glycosidase family protein [Vicinamibacterales bacterium]
MLRATAVALLAAILFVAQIGADVPRLELGEGRLIADGVRHYRIADPSLLDPPGPAVINLLRLDPKRIDLTADLALGDRQGRGPVLDAALRRGAIAAINAGFFVLASGDPTGVLRVDGRLVSEAFRPRGAVAIRRDEAGVLRLNFDRVSVKVQVRAEGSSTGVTVSGIDTNPRPGRLFLYTPKFGPNTAATPGELEWTLLPKKGRGTVPQHGSTGGQSPKYRLAAKSTGGKTAIPADGAVLSLGGPTPPDALASLDVGDILEVHEQWTLERGGNPALWLTADDVVGGAGLLIHDGRPVTDWEVERLTPSFLGRHPRTMIGTDAAGDIWLVTVDGRQPGTSLGMSLLELQAFAQRLGLTGALNLDGGGSTTMVIGDTIVNSPSDLTGARPVSDVLLVLPHPGPPPAAAR